MLLENKGHGKRRHTGTGPGRRCSLPERGGLRTRPPNAAPLRAAPLRAAPLQRSPGQPAAGGREGRREGRRETAAAPPALRPRTARWRPCPCHRPGWVTGLPVAGPLRLPGQPRAAFPAPPEAAARPPSGFTWPPAPTASGLL